MNTTEFMLKYKPTVKQLTDGYAFQDVRPAAKCKDGTTISIQASETHYSTPRQNGLDYYTTVELGYPSVEDADLKEFAEDKENLTDTVYGYVPIDVVDAFVEKHGGIIGKEINAKAN